MYMEGLRSFTFGCELCKSCDSIVPAKYLVKKCQHFDLNKKLLSWLFKTFLLSVSTLVIKLQGFISLLANNASGFNSYLLFKYRAFELLSFFLKSSL